jgi:hypothetical protein
MSVAEVLEQIQLVPREDRAEFVTDVLRALYPDNKQGIARLVRRLENPEIPHDFWEAIEEVEDGKDIEIREEHFQKPPI